MSGEKTEKATPKRRREARKEGQVVKSTEINSAILLLFLYLGMKIFESSIVDGFRMLFIDFLSDKYLLQSEDFMVNFQSIYIIMIKHFFVICAPIFLIGFLTAAIINYLQVGFLFLPNLLAMKFDKINPGAGIKRIFSLRTFVEFLKSVIKMLIVGIVVYFEFKKSFNQIPTLINIDVTQSAIITWSVITNIMWKTGLTLLVFGIFDYAYQWWEHEKKLKMSKEDIKQEYKLMEGDPKVKAKIREIQRHMGMRRMMQRIPQADVVITNPTHFAIALKYDEKVSSAPIVIAKGQDLIALKIKEEAKAHKIHIVENKPLAQALFKTVEIDQAIPEDLYQAVAEILAVVYRMRR